MNIELLGPNEGIALRTCSRCHSTLLMDYFETNRNGKYFKTCKRCRLQKKSSKMVTRLSVLDEDECSSSCSRHEDNIILNQSNTAVFSDLTRKYLPKESWIITHQANLVDSLKNDFR